MWRNWAKCIYRQISQGRKRRDKEKKEKTRNNWEVGSINTLVSSLILPLRKRADRRGGPRENNNQAWGDRYRLQRFFFLENKHQDITHFFQLQSSLFSMKLYPFRKLAVYAFLKIVLLNAISFFFYFSGILKYPYLYASLSDSTNSLSKTFIFRDRISTSIILNWQCSGCLFTDFFIHIYSFPVDLWSCLKSYE